MEVNEPSARYSMAKQQTELGELPSDWSCNQLSEVADILTGFPFPSVGYSYSGIRLLRGSNVKRGQIEWQEELTAYWPEVVSAIKKYQLKAGDVVVAMDGSLVGRSFGALTEQDVPALLLQRVARIRSSLVEIGYLKHWICSERFTTHCDGVKTTTAIPHISPDDIRSFKVAVPRTNGEQQRIAQALYDADTLVNSLEQLLAKKRQIRQGAMQELLAGKRRLPGFAGEWDVAEFRQLGQCVRGVAYNPSTDLSDGDTEQTVRLLRSNNVQGGEIVRDGLQFVDRCRVRGDQYLRAGDLLMCMANGSRELVGKTGRYLAADEYRYTFGAFMGCYRPNPVVVDPEFVSFLFQTHAFRQHVDLLLSGSSINNLRPDGVLGFAIRMPRDRDEQRAIANALNDSESEIAALESRVRKTRALKQAMAQALLTGRIRLVVPGA